MNKKMIWLSAFALSMCVSQVVLACPNQHAWMSGNRFEKITDKLDLTSDQKAKIKTIKMQTKEKLKPKFTEMHANRIQLNELANADVLDESKIDSVINQQKDLLGSVIKMRVMTRNEISKVLTAEQKSKLHGMIAKWDEKHQKKSCGE